MNYKPNDENTPTSVSRCAFHADITMQGRVTHATIFPHQLPYRI